MDADMLDLVERVRAVKEIEGISFKFIAESCGIKYGKFRKFMIGFVRLLPHEERDLNQFLEDKGM